MKLCHNGKIVSVCHSEPFASVTLSPFASLRFIGVSGYPLQIHFDFWAYSILATGLGFYPGFFHFLNGLQSFDLPRKCGIFWYTLNPSILHETQISRVTDEKSINHRDYRS